MVLKKPAACAMNIPIGIVNSALASDESFVCRQLRSPWPEFWKHFQYYG